MTNEEILDLAASVTADMLGIDIPEIRYVRNFEDSTFGFVSKAFPNVVFLDLDEISKAANGYEALVSYLSVLTLIHEMRHLWQQKNGWNYEFHLDYKSRRSEVDADGYAKHHVNNIINRVYAELEIA